jgi:hypothetical protein
MTEISSLIDTKIKHEFALFEENNTEFCIKQRLKSDPILADLSQIKEKSKAKRSFIIGRSVFRNIKIQQIVSKIRSEKINILREQGKENNYIDSIRRKLSTCV